MAEFEKAVNKTLSFEGGYSNDPQDPGLETKFGISKRSYPNEDIKNLTIERAKFLYKKDYWDKFDLDKLDNQELAEKMFDIAVNMGRGTVIDFYKRTVDLLGKNCETTYPELTIKCLKGFQFYRYVEIVNKNSVMQKYIKGWLTRV